MLQDAARAIRPARARAGEWGVDPHRVAILGFAAGGHLAATAATPFDAGVPDPVERQGSRPDRAILIDPVITMKPPTTHRGSRRDRLGVDPVAELVESLSDETQAHADTPPTFLFHPADDFVPAANGPEFAPALRRAKVPVEPRLSESGPHGIGLGRGPRPYAAWSIFRARRLDARGCSKAAPPP